MFLSTSTALEAFEAMEHPWLPARAHPVTKPSYTLSESVMIFPPLCITTCQLKPQSGECQQEITYQRYLLRREEDRVHYTIQYHLPGALKTVFNHRRPTCTNHIHLPQGTLKRSFQEGAQRKRLKGQDLLFTNQEPRSVPYDVPI